MRIFLFFQKFSRKKFLIFSSLLGIIVFFIWVFGPLFWNTPPSFSLPNSTLYDKNGIFLWRFSKNDLAYQEPIVFPEIDPVFLTLFLEKEDENFWTNGGVEFSKKMYLLWQYVTGNGSRGGSTLSEQWIKNKYFRESPRTLLQKGREAILSATLSLWTPKEKILEEYLSMAYFGRGAYGIKSASQVYFQKQFKDLYFLEKCFLITLLSRPQEADTLAKNFEKYKLYFLRIAQEKNLLTPDLLEKYRNEHFVLPKSPEESSSSVLQPFVEYTKAMLEKQNIFVEKGGYTITTTLDKHWQEMAEKIVIDELIRLRANNVHDAGVIILDAKTGAIRTLVGTTRPEDENVGKINTVLLPRPLSSTIKPFLYLYLFLTTSHHPRDQIDDTETEFPLANGTSYIPQNFKGESFGKMALEEALANSANISAVKILNEVGVSEFYNFLTSLGFSFAFPSEHYGLSLALGTAEVSLLDLSSFFTIFPNEGIRISPIVFEKISFPNTVDILPIPNATDVLLSYNEKKKQTALFWIKNALASDVLRQRVFKYSGIFNTKRNFSIKTGTSANFRDNWTIGFSSDLIIGVWTGNIENSKMEEVSGVDGAGEIFAKILEAIDGKGEKLKIPAHLKTIRVCKNDTNITKNFIPDITKCAEQRDTTVEQEP